MGVNPLVSLDWEGSAPWASPPLLSILVLRSLMLRRCLTHGDFALEARVDFLAVVEHRLIPARVRSEWGRLGEKGMASIWAPANQDSSHVGNAGVLSS